MYGYIYKTTDLIENKIYVGQHKRNYFDKTYYGSGLIITNKIKNWLSLGNKIEERFVCEILDIADTQEELNFKEIYWIEKLKARNSDIGYNLCLGGNQGPSGIASPWYHKKRPEEHIQHMKEAKAKMVACNNGLKTKYFLKNKIPQPLGFF